jgi:hypothetical protein
MDDQLIRPGVEQMGDEELSDELRRLHPLLGRQRRAATVRPDESFKRTLLTQLTAPPRANSAPGASVWRTLIASLLPAPPQLSVRGHGPQIVTYVAGDVTVSLAARPADDDPAGDLINLYGEVDYPSADRDEPGSTTVEALRDQAVVAETTLDELGNFVLPNLQQRVYALRLRFPNRNEVIVPPVGYFADGETSLE